MGLHKLKEWKCEVDTALERFLNDEELYVSCLHSFTLEPSFKKLGEILEKKDYEEGFNIAHTLKGVSGNLGLTPLFELTSVFVTCFRQEKYEEFDSLYKQLIQKYEEYQCIMKDI